MSKFLLLGCVMFVITACSASSDTAVNASNSSGGGGETHHENSWKTVIAGTLRSPTLLRSTDSGATWSQSTLSGGVENISAMVANTAYSYCAIYDGGLFR